MTVPNKLFLDRLDRYEKQVLKAFDFIGKLIRFFILEWHRRAHKTTLAINLLIRECCKYPQSKYVYIAPTQVWAREVVWDILSQKIFRRVFEGFGTTGISDKKVPK